MQEKCCLCGKKADIFTNQERNGECVKVCLCKKCNTVLHEYVNEFIPILLEKKQVDPSDFLENNFDSVPSFIKDTVRPISDEAKTSLYIEPKYVFPQNKLDKRCESCGILFEDFLLQNHIYGCKFCFIEFKDDIKEFLETIEFKEKHKDNKNVQVDKKKKIAELNDLKQKAVSLEDWDLALLYKKEIDKLNGK